ncbi:hypothetical protein BDR03DRAFT_650115 [Suillus americanus]|nr:hypothetical protein BDR03DRAFT_650115 [Suillus americanus]
MNDQAQHTQAVGDVHYAVDEFSRAVGMTKSSRNQQFTLSQSYQVFLGLFPEDFQWSQYSTEEVRPVVERRKNQILALGVACTLLLQKGDYDIASGLQDQRVQKVGEIFQLQPFLRGTWDPEAPWTTLGDDLLVSVSATLYYGDTQPSLTSFAPPEGYPISTAVEGTALMRLFSTLLAMATDDGIDHDCPKLMLDDLIPSKFECVMQRVHS